MNDNAAAADMYCPVHGVRDQDGHSAGRCNEIIGYADRLPSLCGLVCEGDAARPLRRVESPSDAVLDLQAAAAELHHVAEKARVEGEDGNSVCFEDVAEAQTFADRIVRDLSILRDRPHLTQTVLRFLAAATAHPEVAVGKLDERNDADWGYLGMAHSTYVWLMALELGVVDWDSGRLAEAADDPTLVASSPFNYPNIVVVQNGAHVAAHTIADADFVIEVDADGARLTKNRYGNTADVRLYSPEGGVAAEDGSDILGPISQEIAKVAAWGNGEADLAATAKKKRDRHAHSYAAEASVGIVSGLRVALTDAAWRLAMSRTQGRPEPVQRGIVQPPDGVRAIDDQPAMLEPLRFAPVGPDNYSKVEIVSRSQARQMIEDANAVIAGGAVDDEANRANHEIRYASSWIDGFDAAPSIKAAPRSTEEAPKSERPFHIEVIGGGGRAGEHLTADEVINADVILSIADDGSFLVDKNRYGASIGVRGMESRVEESIEHVERTYVLGRHEASAIKAYLHEGYKVVETPHGLRFSNYDDSASYSLSDDGTRLCSECGVLGTHKGTCSRSAMHDPGHPFNTVGTAQLVDTIGTCDLLRRFVDQVIAVAPGVSLDDWVDNIEKVIAIAEEEAAPPVAASAAFTKKLLDGIGENLNMIDLVMSDSQAIEAIATKPRQVERAREIKEIVSDLRSQIGAALISIDPPVAAQAAEAIRALMDTYTPPDADDEEEWRVKATRVRLRAHGALEALDGIVERAANSEINGDPATDRFAADTRLLSYFGALRRAASNLVQPSPVSESRSMAEVRAALALPPDIEAALDGPRGQDAPKGERTTVTCTRCGAEGATVVSCYDCARACPSCGQPVVGPSPMDAVMAFADNNGALLMLQRSPRGQDESEDQWTLRVEWGKEAPDSPMAAAASYGIGSRDEAVQTVAEEIGVWKPPVRPFRVDANGTLPEQIMALTRPSEVWNATGEEMPDTVRQSFREIESGMAYTGMDDAIIHIAETVHEAFDQLKTGRVTEPKMGAVQMGGEPPLEGARSVQAFLYVLLRQDVSLGRAEQVVLDLERAGPVQSHSLSNHYLGEYVQSILTRLAALDAGS